MTIVPGDSPKADGTLRAVVSGGFVEIPLAGAIDLEAERARLSKRLGELDRDIERSGTKLANEGFRAKAAPEIVAGEQDKLDAAHRRARPGLRAARGARVGAVRGGAGGARGPQGIPDGAGPRADPEARHARWTTRSCSYPTIHVTGTNGKTTTARAITELACAHGITAGCTRRRTSSPSPSGSRCAATDMTRDEFAAEYEHLLPFLLLVDSRSDEQVTYFEALTALAYLWFADRPVGAGRLRGRAWAGRGTRRTSSPATSP